MSRTRHCAILTAQRDRAKVTRLVGAAELRGSWCRSNLCGESELLYSRTEKLGQHQATAAVLSAARRCAQGRRILRRKVVTEQASGARRIKVGTAVAQSRVVINLGWTSYLQTRGSIAVGNVSDCRTAGIHVNSEIAVAVGNVVQEQCIDVAGDTDAGIVASVVAADQAVGARLYSIITVVGSVIPGDDRGVAGGDPLTVPLIVLPLMVFCVPVAVTRRNWSR